MNEYSWRYYALHNYLYAVKIVMYKWYKCINDCDDLGNVCCLPFKVIKFMVKKINKNATNF